MVSFRIALFCFVASFVEAQTPDWWYKPVEDWATIRSQYQTCRSGRRQSPIRIETAQAIYDRTLSADPLRFSNYAGAVAGTLWNDGRIVRFTVDANLARSERPRIWGSGYGTNGYVLEALEFHWGYNATVDIGSEHLIDGQAAPLEVHFVHYNGRYATYDDAKEMADGLAILAFLVSATSESPYVVSTEYGTIAAELAKITRQGQRIVASFDFSKLLPVWAHRGDGIFYRYQGSITMPPCSEVVSWTVFQRPIHILDETLNYYFQNVMTQVWQGGPNALQPMAYNFRKTQPLRGRQVRTNAPASSLDLPKVTADTKPFICWGTLLCLPSAAPK